MVGTPEEATPEEATALAGDGTKVWGALQASVGEE
jgi:hypothetical protein